MVLFRCGAVWTRVEAAASHAARVRDAQAASWRCRPTPCSAPDLDPWTTAPGFAFHPATARPYTASTTRSSRKVKVCVFLSTATYRWHLIVLRRHSLVCPQECREGTAVSLILKSGTRYSLHFTMQLLTYWLLFLHCPVNTASATETLFRLYSICCYGYSRSILRSIFLIPWENRILKEYSGLSGWIFFYVSLLVQYSIILQWVPSRTLEPVFSST